MVKACLSLISLLLLVEVSNSDEVLSIIEDCKGKVKNWSSSVSTDVYLVIGVSKNWNTFDRSIKLSEVV